jgi:hypothetical protein
MKAIATASAAILMTTLATAALADDVRCPTTAGQDWMPIEKVIAKAEQLGYAVSETKRSKGCWKIEGYDRNGAEIEIRFDGASGEVVKPRGWRAGRGG